MERQGMSFGDLELGWIGIRLKLRNVRLHRQIQLEQLDEQGDWEWREPPHWIGIFAENEDTDAEMLDKWEQNSDVRYQEDRRHFSADGVVDDQHQQAIYLGVPEDKKAVAWNDETRVDSVEVLISELDHVGIADCVHWGRISYSGNDSELNYGEKLWFGFCVPSDVFDKLESWTDGSGVDVAVEIHAKMHHFVGPIGDSQVYIDTENKGKAELTNIAISRAVEPAPTPAWDDDENQPINQAEINARLFDMLTSIDASLKAVRSSIGLGLLLLAGILYLVYQATH
jgi:hypothetical protein